MFCENCGNTLDENGVCPVCTGEETTFVDTVPLDPVEDPGKTLGIVALILGILGLVTSIVCCCLLCGIGTLLGIPLSIAGLILGILAMKKSKEVGLQNTIGMVGMIISIVGLVIGVVMLVLWLLYFILYGGMMGIAMLSEL